MKVRRMHRSFTRRLRGIHAKPPTAAAVRRKIKTSRTSRPIGRLVRTTRGSAYSSGRAGRCERAGRGAA